MMYTPTHHRHQSTKVFYHLLLFSTPSPGCDLSFGRNLPQDVHPHLLYGDLVSGNLTLVIRARVLLGQELQHQSALRCDQVHRAVLAVHRDLVDATG
jgi:hypothetical protein